jgi:LuxR family maltose regulon positive regulatory protein
MTMTLSLHEHVEFSDNTGFLENPRPSTPTSGAAKTDGIHFFPSKVRVPSFEKIVKRQRLDDLLLKSSETFGATLISGRAGTGKTVAAAQFARKFGRVAWYSLESADRDWRQFSMYFSKSFSRKPAPKSALEIPDEITEAYLSDFIVENLLAFTEDRKDEKCLIVLDDLHHIFDAAWFKDVFNLLIFSLLPNTHLLLVCRSRPPVPLWRLRSKQLLNVVEERLLAFSSEESAKVCRKYGLSSDAAMQVYRGSSGRASNLVKTIEDLKAS